MNSFIGPQSHPQSSIGCPPSRIRNAELKAGISGISKTCYEQHYSEYNYKSSELNNGLNFFYSTVQDTIYITIISRWHDVYSEEAPCD